MWVKKKCLVWSDGVLASRFSFCEVTRASLLFSELVEANVSPSDVLYGNGRSSKNFEVGGKHGGKTGGNTEEKGKIEPLVMGVWKKGGKTKFLEAMPPQHKMYHKICYIMMYDIKIFSCARSELIIWENSIDILQRKKKFKRRNGPLPWQPVQARWGRECDEYDYSTRFSSPLALSFPLDSDSLWISRHLLSPFLAASFLSFVVLVQGFRKIALPEFEPGPLKQPSSPTNKKNKIETQNGGTAWQLHTCHRNPTFRSQKKWHSLTFSSVLDGQQNKNYTILVKKNE